ncbi:MAG: hypothetical protein VKJ27_12695 [Synechocystis sp.]|nr:hypothetical protein [Synechocystis sp.]
MSIPPESLVTVAHYLEDHDEGQRIKKLLFCLCKKYWENDPNVLNSHTTETLLAELVQVKPSIEQLTFSMYKLVKTLNRPKVYAAVAKTILDQLGPVYTSHSDAAFAMAEGAIDVPLTEQDTQLEAPQHNSSATPVQTSPPSLSLDTTQTADPQQLAERIAHTLSQHREQVRIQKLIFAVARGYWENSMAVIEQVGLANLILELRQRYPSSWELQSGFEQIVNNINKATLYLAIAQLILKQMEPLYDNADAMALADSDEPQTALNTQMVKSEPAMAIARQPQGRDHLQTSIVNFPAIPVPPLPPLLNDTPSRKPRQTDPIVTVLGAAVPSPPIAVPSQPKSYNLFDMRAEIMQYTNPLRAKVLLFSVLFQSWDQNGQDWGMIRSYGLDDLVEQLILSQIRPNDLEMRLNAQANQMAEQEAYQQTAQTLIKIIKPLL